MAKNKLVQMVQKARYDGYADGAWHGLQIGLNVTAIALNHRFGFGDQRLTVLQGEVQKLIDEIVDMKEPEVTDAHIRRELQRIRGVNYEKSEREVMEQ